MTSVVGPVPGDAEAVAPYSGLQIYVPCLDAAGLVPAETAAGLLALRCAGVPPAWLRPVLLRGPRPEDPPEAERRPGVRVRLPGRVLTEEELPERVRDCRLPAAHLPAERLCVAGLCAVVRRAVKTVDRLRRPEDGHYDRRDDGLLGFRRGTLAPPADASVWTKFVEREVPAALRRVIAATEGSVGSVDGCSSKECDSESPSGHSEPISDGFGTLPQPDVVAIPLNQSNGTATAVSSPSSVRSDQPAQPFTVPPELLQFEHHMQQPLRIHNVWKQEQARGASGAKQAHGWKSGDHRTSLQNIRHVYAEGHVMTISDLLLYPCLRMLERLLKPHGLRLEEAAPATAEWLQRMAEVEGMQEMWSACFADEAALPSGVQLRLSLPTVPPESLYKKDPARYKPKNRLFTVQSDIASALGKLDAARFTSCVSPHPGSGRLRLDWDALPAAASPAEGGLPDSRLQRKHHQLENLAWLAQRAARPGDTIVDFCCGGGHLGLLLAVLLPECHVVLVENKEESLARAVHRVEALRLTNISLYQCNMEFYRGAFQLGVALHACGVATDLVAERCVSARAALLLCPCCYGAVHEFGAVRYPRSAAGRAAGALPRDWLVLGHAADQTHANGSAKSEQGRHCMALVDSDRAAHLRESGYRALLTIAEPPDCSNKNHLILAVPPHWDGDDSFLTAN